MNKKYDEKAAPTLTSSMSKMSASANHKASKEGELWSPKQLEAAGEFWSKLSEAELVESSGNKNKLADLVEKRYSITHDAADKQVGNFFTKNHR